MTLLENYLQNIQEVGWEEMPHGWTRDSMKSYADSIAGEVEDEIGSKKWFDKCVEKVKDEFDDPEAFCASIVDTVKQSTDWRGEED